MTWYEMAKDLVVGGASATGAWVAYQGLETWRAQLHGKTEYDLARRLLHAAFRVRDEIANVRSPLVTPSEVATAWKAGGIDPNDAQARESIVVDRLVYAARWGPLSMAITDLAAEALEGEVIWGRAVRDTHRDLRQEIVRLSVHLAQSLRNGRSAPSDPIKAQEFLDLQSAIVSSNPGGDDAFAAAVEGIVRRFDDLLRPYVQLRHLEIPRPDIVVR